MDGALCARTPHSSTCLPGVTSLRCYKLQRRDLSPHFLGILPWAIPSLPAPGKQPDSSANSSGAPCVTPKRCPAFQVGCRSDSNLSCCFQLVFNQFSPRSWSETSRFAKRTPARFQTLLALGHVTGRTKTPQPWTATL